MTVESGTFARSGTGSVTYLYDSPTFVPTIIFFFLTGRTSGDTETHLAIGYWHATPTGSLDGTLQASAGKSSETRLKTLSHYAGTVEKIAFTVTGTAPGEFTLNYTVAADVNYKIHQISMS